MPITTKHGKKRMKERIGLPRKSLDRQASLALERGLYHRDTKGSLHKWITKQALRNPDRNRSKYVIYNKRLFIFNEDYSRVITVFNVPYSLHKTLDAQIKKNR